MANKVKYNIKNVHYAVATLDAYGKAKYSTPEPITGAVSLSLSASGEKVIFYADGYAYYTVSNNQGYEGDLEVAMLPDKFRTDVLKEVLDTNNVLIESADNDCSHFALLFEFEGDENAIRHVLYNCTCTRPPMNGKTKEESVEVQTETLTINAAPLASGYVKARTCEDTDSEKYNSWYSSVYLPSDATTPEQGL